MNTQENVNTKIILSLNSIRQVMADTPDLRDDVLPFINSTFNKLEELANMDLSDRPDISYEVYQVGTNYLERTINSYCSLPLEYRNTQHIKGDKTARDLMICDLTLLKKQVVVLEKEIFKDVEALVRTSNTFIKTKYASELELANEITPDTFINKFDINSVDSKMVSYFGRKQVIKEGIRVKTKSYVNNTISLLSSMKLFLAWSYPKCFNLMKSILSFFGNEFMIVISILTFMIYMLIYVLIPWINQSNYYANAPAEITTMYDLLKVNKLNSVQVQDLSDKQEKKLVDDVPYSKGKFSFKSNGKNIIASFNTFSVNDCQNFVDYKENSFQNTDVYINNIKLPEVHLYSNRFRIKNNNHKLCYLDSNSIRVDLNAEKINAYGDKLIVSNDDVMRYLKEDESNVVKQYSNYNSKGNIETAQNNISYKMTYDKIKNLEKQFSM